jgi:hypothetical protein
MLANPLGDIGLRRHHALFDRALPGELQRFFFAIVGIGDGANGQDDFNQSILLSDMVFVMIRLIPRYVSDSAKFSRLPDLIRPMAWPAGANDPPGCYKYGMAICAPMAREREQHGDRNRFDKPVV